MEKTWTSSELKNAKVTDKYYDEALHLQVKNMLLLDPDRLLAGFRENAGVIEGLNEKELKSFMKNKERYGGSWENGLIGGHTLGHYITALAQAAVNPGLSPDLKKEVESRLEYMIDALKECQDKTEGSKYEGYVFGATLPGKAFLENPALQFDYVEEGKEDPFTLAWVPWYTMHKILTGFNTCFKLKGNITALKIANRLGLWIAKRTFKWTGDIQKNVLSIEYGGMNDCLYELYVINRELKEKGSDLYCKDYESFMTAAHSFDEEELFEAVLSGKKDVLNDIHANTTIPKFIGALARYEADSSQKKYLDYAESFWDMVITRHSYVTGGNSEDEHFGRDNILDKERTNLNNETCNTYNMLKFSERLFCVTGKKKYLDYYDRTLINAIMASQNHENGFTTYFQPMGSGYHKVFNTLDGNFWCCTGTGYENFTKLQNGIYYKNRNKLMVALYLASSYEGEGYRVIQECDLTRSDTVSIKIESEKGVLPEGLYLRRPEWLQGKPEFTLDDKVIDLKEEDGFYLVEKDMLSRGALLTLKWPMGISCDNLADGKNTYAFSYGPFVLSARLGREAMVIAPHGIAVNVSGKRCIDSDELTITSEKSVEDFIKNIDKYLIKRKGEMEFDLKGVSRSLVFTTHYNQYKESYGIYWKLKVN